MTRQQLEELLIDYLYEELEPEQAAAFEAAAVEHPDLSAEIAAHKATRRGMQQLPEVALPAGLMDAVMAEARIVAGAASAASDKKSFFTRVFEVLTQPAFAAAAVASVVLGVGLLVSGDDVVSDFSESQRVTPVVTRSEQPSSSVAVEEEAEREPSTPEAAAQPPKVVEGTRDNVAVAEPAGEAASASDGEVAAKPPARARPKAARKVSTEKKKAERRAGTPGRRSAPGGLLAEGSTLSMDAADGGAGRADETLGGVGARGATRGGGRVSGPAGARLAKSYASSGSTKSAGALAADRADDSRSKSSAAAYESPPAPKPASSDQPGRPLEETSTAAPAPRPATTKALADKESAPHKSQVSEERRADGLREADDDKEAAPEQAGRRPADDSDDARAAQWWRRFEKAMDKGQLDTADEALDALEAIPSQRARVREARKKLAALKKSRSDAARKGTTEPAEPRPAAPEPTKER